MIKNQQRPKPVALIILDGWGYREDPRYNAIAQARTPNWDRLWQTYPHMLLSGSGLDVGLPDGQMGNSEVGHLHIGAGRLVPQELTRINRAIESGEFFKNKVLLDAIELAKSNQKVVHLIGLCSPGGVHSHDTHIKAAAELCQQVGAKAVLHAILDGRDTPPKSAKSSLQMLSTFVPIVSMIGRYYAMDRDKRWERTEQAYELLTHDQAPNEQTQGSAPANALDALEKAYDRGETDEFVKPILIDCENGILREGDVVIFMNFRADRARQLSRAFTHPDFDGFHRKTQPHLGAFVTLTEYAADIKAKVAFPPQSLKHILGACLAENGLKQLRLAETEKYAHVTFFINGGTESVFPGEERILIPSPKVATYDLKPEMSAYEVTDAFVKAIQEQNTDVIICNYANADMVGHTGHFEACVKAIEALDKCLGRIAQALEEVGGEALITSDHGNAELMFDSKTGQAHTAHTTEYVPLIYLGKQGRLSNEIGKLTDLAPTLLKLLHLPIPREMTGHSLVQ